LDEISEPIQYESDIYMVILGEKSLPISLKIANKLREELKLSVITEPSRRGMKAQMKEANRQNAKYAIILGEDEIEHGIASIKNMIKGTQHEVDLDKIITFFKEN